MLDQYEDAITLLDKALILILSMLIPYLIKETVQDHQRNMMNPQNYQIQPSPLINRIRFLFNVKGIAYKINKNIKKL
ncbi:unnamed protein product [Paramecium octaurelia]|uniref:Uncharacterized protein n=1 Tax=Paramecium octaurelia TaxID=43137 RepID=A0A8S1YL75_PAROT|nr:unnamed protein product [Paramecium octaurelia]